MAVEFIAAAVIGTILGFLTGLGIGGGSLLILWLTLVLGWDQSTARGINLLFFLPAAAISTLFRHAQGDLKYRRLLPAMISGCIFAAVFTVVSRSIDLHILRRFFGILLLATGIRELLYHPGSAKGS